MRRVIVLLSAQIYLLAVLAAERGECDKYFPTGMKWKEVLATPGMPLDTTKANLFEIGGDTLIGKVNYKKVFRNNKQCRLWLREEEQSVWILTNEYPSEIKLYDFDWNGEVKSIEVLRAQGEELELTSVTINTNDYNTVRINPNTCYDYILGRDGTIIHGIGRVSELNRNACLLGYKLPEVMLPGLEYHKILWISRDGETVFRSNDSNEWIDSIPKISESDQFIDDRYLGFMLYENGECSYYTLYGKCTIDGIDYIKEDNGRYCYRQEGNKVYCYSLAEQKEYLVMDFGLKVGDVFTLYDGFNVVVEQQSDTLLTCWNAQKTCKKLHLRGVEQPDFTDVWIEGIGSLRYGINPPKAEETYLLHSSMFMEECEEYCDYCTFVFEPQKDDLCATMVELEEEIYEDAFSDYDEYEEAFYDKFMTFGLSNDTLHIGGYIGTYCEQSQYFLIEEGVGTIHIMSVPFPLAPEADCHSVNAIDVKLPGFTQDRYTIYYNDKVVELSQIAKPYLVTEGLQWAKCYNYYPGNYRSVAYEFRGDTIIDGKSYKKEWSTDWEDLSHMELTGNFMREEAGKVYRKSKNSNEYLWFDYEANIGDTIFYDDCFVKVIGHSDTTIVCNGVSRTYKGVDVQVGGISGSDTDYEYSLVPGYVETFYEDLGLFRNGDVVSDPSFLTTGGWIELLWLKRDSTMLYQQEEGVLWKDNTGIEVPKSEQADIYYDLQGRPVAHPTRGIYIKDGKKVAIK